MLPGVKKNEPLGWCWSPRGNLHRTATINSVAEYLESVCLNGWAGKCARPGSTKALSRGQRRSQLS
ncbi:hypothetical protein HMPREF9621_01311 [Cutibacterium modestum HL037PA2]|nr:hypothetical protein HMPREF9621_01311 [Cutibacterium modestum HL037PA2]REB74520.1 hypothetical protein CP877_01140 [Cutibacterium modestum]